MNNLHPKSIKFYHLKLTPMTFANTCDIIVKRIKRNIKTVHACLNANKLMVSENDTYVKNALLNADIVSPDGITILLLSKLLKINVRERVTGIDLMDEILSEAEINGFSIFFLGSRPEILVNMKKKLLEKYPNLIICGMQDGYFDFNYSNKIVNTINNAKAKILFVGMSSPLKEKFIENNKNNLECNLIMGVGGSFDIISGSIIRSPKIIQKAGFEWFYRIIQEPARLSYRYLKNFFYLIKLIIRKHIIKRYI